MVSNDGGPKGDQEFYWAVARTARTGSAISHCSMSALLSDRLQPTPDIATTTRTSRGRSRMARQNQGSDPADAQISRTRARRLHVPSRGFERAWLDAFLDTNIVIYLFSADASKADRAGELLERGGTVSV